jgi:hypothetical protein
MDQNYFKPYMDLKKLICCYMTIYTHIQVSEFRYEEFTVLMSEFVDSKIIMTDAYPVVNNSIVGS